jgi:ubiquinone/menaquinone biosynthesis C-methylase UbiE
MAELLQDSADPQFMGGRLQFYTALYEDFLAFPKYLRSGETWPRSEHDPWLLAALTNMTKPDCVMITDAVLPQAPALVEQLEAGGTILDIGPSGGHHMIHYARRFPNSRVVGLEIDPVGAELARQAVSDAGLEDRAEVVLGDANELAEESAYDLVTMSISLHETGGPGEYRNVLARVRRALTPGGALVVSELPYPDSPRDYRERPVYQALAGVQFHEAIVGCGAITQGELRELLAGAGFTNPRVVDQPLPARFVMLAEK